MKPNYTVIIYTPQELSQSSYIQTGLFELENTGMIKVKVKLYLSKNLGRVEVSENGVLIHTNRSFTKTSFYKLIDNISKKELRFAVDLYDFPNQFSTGAFEKCDVVFKRNYESKYVVCLPDKHKNKIHPLNLTFWVHSDYKRKDAVFFMGLLLSNLYVNFKKDRLLFKRLFMTYRHQLNHWKFIKTSRKLSRYQSFKEAKKNIILFQTRCFLREDQKDVIAIHQQRYHLIKLLKDHFSIQFMGGFTPSKISTEKYHDALSNVPSDPELYLDVLKSAKIVIYTRGLANSPAWKMAEYLSQGKVIIAEPLTAELPIPLQHGKEVLFFNSDKELVENIQLVLSDVALADQLSKNARDYYEKHVDPAQNVKRMLDIVIANFKGQI